MFILVLIGVYLVFKVTTSYEKLHQDNTRSTERYVILREVIKLYKILEIVVISTQRDSYYLCYFYPGNAIAFSGFLYYACFSRDYISQYFIIVIKYINSFQWLVMK